MNNHAADTLHAAIERTGSIACVGLDPRPSLIPPALKLKMVEEYGDTVDAVAAAFVEFNCGLIDAIAGSCAAVKPQAACYEAYGSQGMMALEDTVDYAHSLGIPVILDGKRNDIGSTAEHYHQAYLGAAPGLAGERLPGLGADWLTINAYLGSDGVKPFLGTTSEGGGVFVLVKTSNPSSGEVQDVALAATDNGPATVMERLAMLVHTWGSNRLGACGLSDVGAVVGATYPQQARRLRLLMPDNYFLVPGYGAQGGSAKDALAGARSDGRGLLINSSRAIIGAWQSASGTDWQNAARAALAAMNADIARSR